MIITAIVNGVIIFLIIAVGFVLAFEILLPVLELENPPGSSTFKESFELKD